VKKGKADIGRKVEELREIAKKVRFIKVEGIDGGIKPSKNVYSTRIEASGLMIDLRTGKKMQIASNRIISELNKRQRAERRKTEPLPPLIRKMSGKASSVIKFRERFPSLSRFQSNVKSFMKY
jgi:hypothetical protein